MSRALVEIERDIRALSDDERVRLLRALIADLDGPPDLGAEQAWLEESEKRLAEIESGAVQTVSGEGVLREARSLLKK
jgi:putative addiction module component (TIGR02574 family)